MSTALYRKYRSKSLADVVGQRHITDILERALKAGKISHAYLFTGPRGVGKTSVARILAHQINQLPYSDDTTHLDIIEIDAASNNGVDDVRDLREKVQLAPVSASHKVYIIDEVHMLSKPAFNALLKTLEEPPEHVVFILATTDVEKLPATIISRTQRFGFRAIGREDVIAHLKSIAKDEGITVDDEALALVAERGDGSFRDSISLLDQLSSLADEKTGITASLVESSLGLAPTSVVNDLIKAVEDHDVRAVTSLLEKASSDGISPITLSEQLTGQLRHRIVERPQLMSLLDALLDVPKSTQPSLKLLSVLGSAAMEAKAVKTVALSAPVLEVSASIDELSRQAVKAKPSQEAIDKAVKKIDTPAAKPSKQASEFDFSSLVAYAKEHFVALYSVLSKCAHVVEGDDLNLYTLNNFYKKKLDDPKYSAHLHESLTTLGYQLTVHTIPTRPAPKSSQAASVAAIMGGGEEVSLDAS
jgi:DNA polymerase-3 subunit gamma/tau